jgi:hypothetical protein
MAHPMEYGLIAAGISVAIIAVVNTVGKDFLTSSGSTTQPVVRSQTPPAPPWATKCEAYKDLKITYPDVYAYLERQNARLPKCAS